MLDWAPEHPLPSWVKHSTNNLSQGRRKDLERTAQIEAQGIIAPTPCETCAVRGHDCKILFPSKGALKCSRCTCHHYVCSLVCNRPTNWGELYANKDLESTCAKEEDPRVY